MGIPTTERARVSWQCVVSQELAGPKFNPKGVERKGNWLIFQCLKDAVRESAYPTLMLPDKASKVIALFNRSRPGECRNDENLVEARMASH